MIDSKADMDRSGAQLEGAATELPLVIGKLRRRLRRVSSDSELNWSQLAVLSRLAKEGAMSTAQLARTESMRPQSMGVVVSGLEKRGLISREAHPSDRRQVNFNLTPAGAASNRERRAARQEWIVHAIAKLTADEQQILIAAIGLLKQLGETE